MEKQSNNYWKAITYYGTSMQDKQTYGQANRRVGRRTANSCMSKK